MGLSLLRYLAYALIPAVTVLWGESLRGRLLYRGGRRAIRLLIAALLMWQLVRLMKYMFEPVADASPEHAFWYLFYVFRAHCRSHCSGLPMSQTQMPRYRNCRAICCCCCS